METTTDILILWAILANTIAVILWAIAYSLSEKIIKKYKKRRAIKEQSIKIDDIVNVPVFNNGNDFIINAKVLSIDELDIETTHGRFSKSKVYL